VTPQVLGINLSEPRLHNGLGSRDTISRTRPQRQRLQKDRNHRNPCQMIHRGYTSVSEIFNAATDLLREGMIGEIRFQHNPSFDTFSS
jgi:hypothetical protein